jgi:predicted RNA binding protein YcfA (HicA-like mRNA interferase family)
MKLPRDWSGRELAAKLSVLGYEIVRQTGSHIRLTTTVGGEHHITIPDHDPLKIGTLNQILREVAEHHGLTREELLELLGA